MSYTVFIPCAGLGSRLGTLTRHLPKALVSVSHIPAISRVLHQFPADCRFVIATGYKGDLLQEYLTLAHPDLNLEFVAIDCYEGEGSGLGYTLLCAEALLQQPFVFCSCDTLVTGFIPPPDHNWAAWDHTRQLSPYRTLDLDAQQQVAHRVLAKNQHHANARAYIGLAGIHDWATFWQAMRAGGTTAIDEGEAWGLNALCEKAPLSARLLAWHDTGTPDNLARAEAAYPPEVVATILPKENEAIWFVDGQVIKFSTDTAFIANRVARVHHLGSFVPPITGHNRHFYRYARVEGEVLSRLAHESELQSLLGTCQQFWAPVNLTEAQQAAFHANCLRFYRDKTRERVALFYQTYQQQDNARWVNGVAMPTLEALLSKLDWDWLSHGLAGRFHGDFHFENILLTRDGGFCFLDWRQEFCGELAFGDIYYDLAKLNHGLIVNHELIAANQYQAEWEGEHLRYDFHRYQRLVACEHAFEQWLQQHGYDARKMRILTALVYLNIAALHHAPYSLMLYGLGKSLLFRELQHDL